jgi:hypothetical protein
MNDQMAAILEAHREVVVREFVAWFFSPTTSLADYERIDGPEIIVEHYLAHVNGTYERAARMYDEKIERPTMRHPTP